jgi:hypothetical protein
VFIAFGVAQLEERALTRVQAEQMLTGASWPMSWQRSSTVGDIRGDSKMGDAEEGVVQKKFQREPHPSRSTVAS